MSSEGDRRRAEPVSSDDFRRACGRFATGVAIAGVMDANGLPHGLTVNSFSSVSLDPPLILICLGHAIAAIDVFREARHFGLSVLRANQRALSERFAAPMDNRFDSLAWRKVKPARRYSTTCWRRSNAPRCGASARAITISSSAK